ncbi:hypothetical protein NBRC116494_07710 [Aurantivibrio plasticivorans]
MTRPPSKPEPQTDNNKASVLNRIENALREYYIAPFRQSIGRAQRDEDDLFMLLVMAETLGIPNPTTYYTLELLPIIYDRFHEWHKRMGMERSPLDHVHCC